MKRNLIAALVILVVILAACKPSPEPASDAAGLTVDNSALIARGEAVFKANCSSCHTTTSDKVQVGPSMLGLASRAGDLVDGLDARGYIKQSILEPGAFLNEGFNNLMPATYVNSLPEEDIDSLVEYLLTFD
jgi:mono/diheme cytochrome c family protein